MIRISGPYYLLLAKARCYHCGKGAQVCALSADNITDLDDLADDDEEAEPGDDETERALIHSIRDVPAPLLAAIRTLHPTHELRRSHTTGATHYMNVCPHCGAHFGDFYLFNEPEGAFFPIDDDASKAIDIHTLPVTGTFDLSADCSYGPGEEIFRLARRH